MLSEANQSIIAYHGKTKQTRQKQIKANQGKKVNQANKARKASDERSFSIQFALNMLKTMIKRATEPSMS